MSNSTVKSFLEPYHQNKPFANYKCESKPKTFRELKKGDFFIPLNKRGIAMGWGYNEFYQIKTTAIYQKDSENSFSTIGRPNNHQITLTATNTPACLRLLTD